MDIMLGATMNNIKIFVDEATLLHMKAHSYAKLVHIKEALKRIHYSPPFFIGSIDLGHIIGKSICVERCSEDDVEMVFRKGKEGRTPIFITAKTPEETTKIVIWLCTDEENKTRLVKAYYGELAPREPWDPCLTDDEREESEKFWSTHAIIDDSCDIDWERSRQR